MAEQFVKGEKIVKDLKAKKVYNYVDSENSIDQLSREVYNDKNVEIHYPRGFEGGDKYKNIKKITYINFKKKFPVGVFKSVSYGWGFTKPMAPFSDYVDNVLKIEEIIIEKDGKVDIDVNKKVMLLNDKALSVLFNAFQSIYKKNKEEIDFTLRVNLNNVFPAIMPKPEKTYTVDALANSLASWGNDIDEFSDSDKNAIKDLFDKLSIGTDFLTSASLSKTKEIVDVKYIQATLKEYKRLMALKTDSENLEKQWQEFLRDNSWIFSSIFAQPVILFKREAYVGGKNLDNHNGKFNDFLIKNSLSSNVSFLELKTHKTKLVESNPYRGEDVYSVTKELTGCMVQVLNQRDNFQKEFYATKVKSRNNSDFETFNSKCVVLIGSSSDLDENQKYSFELFRSNCRDVEILTFDELQRKIESLQSIMTSK